MIRIHRLSTATAILCLISAQLFISGCGESEPDIGPTGTVSGTVKLDGKPVENGSIRFTGEGNSSFGADLQPGGAFTIPTPVPVGTYKVSVNPPTVGPSAGPGGEMKPADPAALQSNIPAKYLSDQTTDVTQTIKEGENTFDIQLTP